MHDTYQSPILLPAVDFIILRASFPKMPDGILTVSGAIFAVVKWYI